MGVKTAVRKDNKNVNVITDESFIRGECPVMAGTERKIHRLWEGAYRVNYWGERVINPKKGKDNCIIRSVFIVVKKVKDGFVVETREDVDHTLTQYHWS